MSQNPTSDNNERLIRGAGTAVAYFRLAKAVIFSLIWISVVALFWAQSVPYYYVLPALAVPILIMALEIKSLMRFKRLDLSAPQPSVRVQADPHEKLLGTVAGVMPIGARGGGAVLGTGQIKATENALIVTDKNVYAITVPLAGAGKIVAGQDVSLWQWMLGGGQIRKKLDILTAGKSLQEILDAVTVNKTIAMTSEPSEIQDERRTFIFNPLSHNSVGYAILGTDEYQKAKQLFNR